MGENLLELYGPQTAVMNGVGTSVDSSLYVNLTYSDEKGW